MKRMMLLSPRGRGSQVVAIATLLIVPVAALAWLSPGLVTASSGLPNVGWLAFEVPTAPPAIADANPSADSAQSLAEDWGYTGLSSSERRRAERRTLRLTYVLARKSLREAGASHARYSALRAAYRQNKIDLRNYQRANPNSPSPRDLVAPADMFSPFI